MLFRKIASRIEEHLRSDSNKVLVVSGARQVGKTFIIRSVGRGMFRNFIEVNLLEDSMRDKLFAGARTVRDFYLQLSVMAGDRMGDKSDTLVFLDEIQVYPHLLTLLKFLKQDDRFTYIASGSLLGVTLAKSESIPIGSIQTLDMYQLDFEEFLHANGVGGHFVGELKSCFADERSLPAETHAKIMDLFRKYLIVGGLPDAVNSFVEKSNVVDVRRIQAEISEYYKADASKYDKENRLKIRRIYDMLPSNLANRKKRVVIQDIDGKRGKTFGDYANEFDYLISSGVAIEVKAVSNPVFPLISSQTKNLLKLYLNDVGLLTDIYFGPNINAILSDRPDVNLGAVYENVVASELRAHGHNLFYYDSRKNGEVDYLLDDYESLSCLPIEVKSGRGYRVHSALTRLVSTDEFGVKKALGLSNDREVKREGKVVYVPVYMVSVI